MKVVASKLINNKLAQLVLKEDNVTVQVVYDDKIISESSKGTWDNLKCSDLKKSYLNLIVLSYLDNLNSKENFEEFLKKVGWE